MPKTNDGWTLDDSPDFTDAQMARIRKLVVDGKQDEADALIDKILAEKEGDQP